MVLLTFLIRPAITVTAISKSMLFSFLSVFNLRCKIIVGQANWDNFVVGISVKWEMLLFRDEMRNLGEFDKLYVSLYL